MIYAHLAVHDFCPFFGTLLFVALEYKIRTMRDKPMMHIGARIERSSHRKLKQVIKESNKTTSEFLREIINEKIKELSDDTAFNNNIIKI